MRYTGVKETLQREGVCKAVAPARCDVAVLRGDEVAEIYLTVTTSPGVPPPDQAEATWKAIAAVLAEHDAFVIEERVFLSDPTMVPLFRACRSVWMRGRDAGVEPTWLVGPNATGTALSGIAVRAVAGGVPPQTIRYDGRPVGRIWRCGTYALVAGSCLEGVGETAVDQARDVFLRADGVLQAAEMSWREVSRTWFWLRCILSWYGDFNAVRTRFFGERKVMMEGETAYLPASTGIGVSPASGRLVALDVVAERGALRWPVRHTARQGDAYHYGSAFSRGVALHTPFGMRAYVSGTASIGPDGRTRFAGDPRAQIEETWACVQAVLHEVFGVESPRVVQAIAYCKTLDIEDLFRALWHPSRGPCLVVRADICRPELLFELECIAGL